MNPIECVFEKIDKINKTDPNQREINGKMVPYEYIYSIWLCEWVFRLSPHASESLRIAARGQHIGRWKRPRKDYPMDRGGYLRWREQLKIFHADTVAEIMSSCGFNEDLISETRNIILKKNRAENANSQTMEDALCLVFLEKQFLELKRKTAEEKMIEIIKKTWGKMSDQARAEALKLSSKNVILECLNRGSNET